MRVRDLVRKKDRRIETETKREGETERETEVIRSAESKQLYRRIEMSRKEQEYAGSAAPLGVISMQNYSRIHNHVPPACPAALHSHV